MLALGRAVTSELHLICLDEPSLGIVSLVVEDIFRTIRTMNAAGTSVLLVEQNARYALEHPGAEVTCCRQDRSSRAVTARRCAMMIACAKPIWAAARLNV